MSIISLHDERSLMEMAIAQASLSEHGGLQDPKVGAVLVQGGTVIGHAHRGQMAKGDHAEFTLLHKILRSKDLTSNTTLFTTLEPCTTRSHDKLPCAEWIISKKISKVVIGILDPNPSICGRGYWRLKEAGISVEFFPDELAQKIITLNQGFIDAHRSSSKMTSSLAKMIQRMKSVTISPFSGLGWGDALSIQDCPNAREGWPLDQIVVQLTEDAFVIPAKQQPAYDQYFKLLYEEKRFADDFEKFMVLSNPVAFTDSPTLRIELKPTKYSQVCFYRDTVARTPVDRNFLINDFLRGTLKASIPHTLCMHMIVITDDNKVLMTKRSPKVEFYPQAWSISIEEQISREDLHSGQGHAILNLAQRQLSEELGLDQDSHRSSDMRLLSVFLEADYFNISLCATAQIRLPSYSLDAMLRSSPRPDYEFTEWQFLELEKKTLLTELVRPTRTYHPTSGYRLLKLYLKHFGIPTDADFDAVDEY